MFINQHLLKNAIHFYATQKRIVKDSAWEHKRMIEKNGAYL
jgi:hypothetical protein